jgi:hypothetical protein
MKNDMKAFQKKTQVPKFVLVGFGALLDGRPHWMMDEKRMELFS